MPVQSFGSVTVAGALPGFSAQFDALGASLPAILARTDGAVATLGGISQDLVSIGDLVASIGDGLLDIKAALRVPVGGDVALQYSAALQAIANLGASIANPTAYITAQVNGALQAIANLGAVPPLVKIQGQIAATTSISLQLQAKVAAIDAALASLDAPAAQLTAQGLAIRAAADAVDVVVDSLQLASNAVNVALTGFNAYAQGPLATGGLFAFYYTGTLGGFGAAIDAATPGTGISAATAVVIPVVLAVASDTAATAAISATYRTS